MNPPEPALTEQTVYAPARAVTTTDECLFYHTMHVPGHGLVEGGWDLREGVDTYLGHVDLAGKRVLEIGPADGYLTFHMESRGADVVAYDLSADHAMDLVPFPGPETEEFDRTVRTIIDRFNNAFWFCHRAHGSRAKAVYGSVYDIPEEIGRVDVCTFGSVLLHVRDPFQALAAALRLTAETVVVTEFLGPVGRYKPWKVRQNSFGLAQWLSRLKVPTQVFLPEPNAMYPRETWWLLTPALVQRFIGAHGFTPVKFQYHVANFQGIPHKLYTVVGRRTKGAPVV